MSTTLGGAEPHRTLLDAISELTRIQREVGAVIARDLECPRAAIAAIRVLERRGDLGVGDLAGLLHVDISVASRQVGALVDAGLVARSTPDAPGVDRRTRTVRLTTQGRAFAAEVDESIDAHARGAFASWEPEEIAAAAAHLHKVAAGIAAEHAEYVRQHETRQQTGAPTGQPHLTAVRTPARILHAVGPARPR